jgi:hypothetical protein
MITVPTDTAAGLLARKLLIRIARAERVRTQSMAAKRQHNSTLRPRTASHKIAAQKSLSQTIASIHMPRESVGMTAMRRDLKCAFSRIVS